MSLGSEVARKGLLWGLSRVGLEESGQALILVVLTMVAMVGLLALATDGSNIYVQRRLAQNAADAAALAGARQVALGADESTVAAEIFDYVQRNGIASPPDDVSWSYLVEIGEQVGVQVTVTKVFSTTFSRILGMPSLTVVASAISRQAPRCGGTYALWADGDIHIEQEGSGFCGNVHANGSILLEGQGHEILGDITYVGDFIDHSTDSSYSPPTNVSYQPCCPVTYSIYDYRQEGSMAREAESQGDYHYIGGNLTIGCASPYVTDGALDTGLYYVSGDLVINCEQLSGNVTLVTEGTLELAASERLNLSAYSGGLLLFSNYEGLDRPAIGVSPLAEKSALNGDLFAPRGEIEVLAEKISLYNGTLVGRAVTFAGERLMVNFNPNYEAGNVFLDR